MGSERLENELCIEKAIKNIRDMKILIKNKFMTEEEKFRVQHNFKNVLDLEEPEHRSSDSDDPVTLIVALGESKTANPSKKLN